jgi:hypothetical protein
MNESAFALFMQGFKRSIWLSFAAPVAVVEAIVRTLITLSTAAGPFDASAKKPQR